MRMVKLTLHPSGKWRYELNELRIVFARSWGGGRRALERVNALLFNAVRHKSAVAIPRPAWSRRHSQISHLHGCVPQGT